MVSHSIINLFINPIDYNNNQLQVLGCTPKKNNIFNKDSDREYKLVQTWSVSNGHNKDIKKQT
jgi:hypothetical protein